MAVVVSLKDWNTAIETTLGAAAALDRDYDYDEVPGALADLPAMVVLPQVWFQARDSDTAQNTFGTATIEPARHFEVTFWADAMISTVMTAQTSAILLDVAEDINDILNDQRPGDYFGDPTIKSFEWDAERVLALYSKQMYITIRYAITVRTF